MWGVGRLGVSKMLKDHLYFISQWVCTFQCITQNFIKALEARANKTMPSFHQWSQPHCGYLVQGRNNAIFFLLCIALSCSSLLLFPVFEHSKLKIRSESQTNPQIKHVCTEKQNPCISNHHASLRNFNQLKIQPFI